MLIINKRKKGANPNKTSFTKLEYLNSNIKQIKKGNIK